MLVLPAVSTALSGERSDRFLSSTFSPDIISFIFCSSSGLFFFLTAGKTGKGLSQLINLGEGGLGLSALCCGGALSTRVSYSTRRRWII